MVSDPFSFFSKRLNELRYTAVFSLGLAFSSSLFIGVSAAPANKAIDQWVEQLQPSAISEKEMRKELQWFKNVSKPFRGKTIKSVAEDIKTHYWERDVLAKAFFDITGIRVEHEIIGEGAVVEALLQQMRTGKNSLI